MAKSERQPAAHLRAPSVSRLRETSCKFAIVADRYIRGICRIALRICYVSANYIHTDTRLKSDTAAKRSTESEKSLLSLRRGAKRYRRDSGSPRSVGRCVEKILSKTTTPLVSRYEHVSTSNRSNVTCTIHLGHSLGGVFVLITQLFHQSHFDKWRIGILLDTGSSLARNERHRR